MSVDVVLSHRVRTVVRARLFYCVPRCPSTPSTSSGHEASSNASEQVRINLTSGNIFFCYTHFVQAYKIKKNLSEKERAPLAKYDNLLAHLLFHRGNDNTDKAEKFLNPNYDEHIHDPFLLKGAEKMAIRFIQAIKNDERIAIYADYDADGIPGAAIFGDLFKKIGYKNYSVYIPHRHDEGFGLNKEAVEQLGQEGVKLLITVDCGITDVDPVIRANELGIDVIITDHHEPPAVLPPAFAIVDHKQNDCLYPDKNLCGSGIAYKLVQAILKIDRLGIKEGHEKWLLDLVGIATLSDMVPLIGENRIFAHYGLAVLRKSPRKGLISLLNKLNIDQRYITEDDIAFMVTPRINAASRMGLPMDAFHLLVADNENDANHYADHLDKINNERKGVVASLVKEVKKIIHERYQVSFPKVLVLGNPLWRPSLLGLVANACAEEYGRPAFFWGKDGDNTIKGSCRSEGKTNVVELMRAVVPQKTFIQYGGHKHSGGFAISHEEIHYLEQRLNEAFDSIFTLDTIAKADGDNDETSSNQDSADDSAIDMELTLDEVGRDLFEEVNRLAPFGVGNPKPVFIFRKIIPISVRKFGKGNEHIELTFSKKSAQKIKAISFFGVKEKWLADLEVSKPIDLIASIEKSTFRGANEIRLRVVDIVHI